MKKFFSRIEVLVVLGLIVVGIFYIAKERGKAPAEISEVPLVKNSPYTIQNLKNRSYGGGTLEKVRQVTKNSKFESWVVKFKSDGLTEYALLDIPSGNKPKEGWPVVMVNHGHINPSKYSTETSYVNTATYFANSGFLVLKPDYRGHDKSEGQAETLTARIEYSVDVLNLVALIPSISEANPNRIYMYGHSMGGEVTLRAIEISNKIKAATLWAPAVTSFPEGILYFIERDTPNKATAIKNELDKAFDKDEYSLLGSLENVAQVKIPVNIQHATTDPTVPFGWGKALFNKMNQAGVVVNFYSYENDDHDLSRDWATALARDVQLFNQTANPSKQPGK